MSFLSRYSLRAFALLLVLLWDLAPADPPPRPVFAPPAVELPDPDENDEAHQWWEWIRDERW